MNRLSSREYRHSLLYFSIFLYLLMVLARLIFSMYHPPQLSFNTPDSERYYYSGLFFAQTGQICYPVPTQSAWIMPGISVLIGTLSRLFPSEQALLWAIRICWILIGSFAPVYIYRSTRLFTPNLCAVLTAFCYLLPWYIEIDCYLQTEGPAFAFFSGAVYYGLLAGMEPGRFRHTVLFAVFLVLGIFFRASNLLLLPFMLFWQLLCRKASPRMFLRNVGTVCAVLLLFLSPWVIRNHRLFHAFIPLTYSAGDPVYEGSFFGEGAPSDEELLALQDGFDPAAEIARQHPDLFDEQGNPVSDSAEQYAHHLFLAVSGKQRLRQWFRLHPRQFLKTYLYLKPKSLLNDTWYWDQVMGISLFTAVRLRQINLLLCLLAGLLSLLRKKLLCPVWFLGLTYTVNLYIVAFSLPLDRYGQAIMPYRLILAGIGLYLLSDFLQSKLSAWKNRPAAAA